MTTHQLELCDARKLDFIEDESVNLVITSPPYWNIKDYGYEDQIGFYSDYNEYIEDLNLVWKECMRVLKPGSRLCINVMDTFTKTKEYGRHKCMPIHSDITLACEKIGFDYLGQIIWRKIGNHRPSGGGVWMGSYPYPRNGILKYDYEYIMVFKKLGDSKEVITKELKESSKISPEEWKVYFDSLWTFDGVRQDNHVAKFPEELPNRLIKMFSFIGDVVLDPFSGSGTTTISAFKLGRNSIGTDLNPEYIDLSKSLLKKAQETLKGE